jgi:quinol monooxygenase YgiN
MSVVVVATIRPLPEHRDEVIAAFTQIIGDVHAEDGCELYALNETGDRLIMVEKWASREALAAHSKGENLAALNPLLKGKVAGPSEVIVLEAVPAGDPEKGQI